MWLPDVLWTLVFAGVSLRRDLALSVRLVCSGWRRARAARRVMKLYSWTHARLPELLVLGEVRKVMFLHHQHRLVATLTSLPNLEVLCLTTNLWTSSPEAIALELLAFPHLRLELDCPHGPCPDQFVGSVTGLTLGSGLSSTKSLVAFSGLERLAVSGHSVLEDATLLAGLVGLRDLTLRYRMEYQDLVCALASAKIPLKRLSLGRAASTLSEVGSAALGRITTLEDLTLDLQSFDLGGLSQLDKLRALRLGIERPEGTLGHLGEQLEILRLGFDLKRDVTQVWLETPRRFPKLDSLHLQNSAIASLDTLDCPQLRKLVVAHCPRMTASGLARCRRLRRVVFDKCASLDDSCFAELAELAHLEVLTLKSCHALTTDGARTLVGVNIGVCDCPNVLD